MLIPAPVRATICRDRASSEVAILIGFIGIGAGIANDSQPVGLIRQVGQHAVTREPQRLGGPHGHFGTARQFGQERF